MVERYPHRRKGPRNRSKIQQYKSQAQRQEKDSIKNPFLEISAQLRAKHPSLPYDEIVIRTMDCLKDQFFKIMPNPKQSAGDESMTSAKSNDLEDNNPFSCLPGESQDPYEKEGNEAILVDYWDGTT